MLILGDEGHYHGRFPWMTVSLVVINVLVYVAQVFIGEPLTNGWALVPEEIVTFHDLQGTKYRKVKIDHGGHYDHRGEYHPNLQTKHFPIKHYRGPFPIFITLFTSMFLHGDVFHLIGNMWFLLVFGRNVECAMSHGRFLMFYTACGIAAGLAHVVSEPHSIVPCIGASGAISGVMGAYVSIHPLNKIKIWLGWLFGVIEVPAIIVIGIWFLLQYLSAFLALDDESASDGIAYWAHLGGFAAGFVIIRGVVFYLRRQQAQGQMEEAEPLAPLDPDALPPEPATDDYVPDPIGANANAVKAGAPDPFATFLSVQTIRNIQEKSKEKVDEHP
ncbi:MAG TPA: rhomboid family intramembrane serine protease [Gemmataceae bacterium]|nr:rhomboid family intramembrane serine protease [Gemmataceae bacterium]